jgi:hypothetical protein
LTALEFEKRSDFPHCLGAIDGKHFRLIKPEPCGSMFCNYKAFFHGVIAVADTNYRFMHVDFCGYG